MRLGYALSEQLLRAARPGDTGHWDLIRITIGLALGRAESGFLRRLIIRRGASLQLWAAGQRIQGTMFDLTAVDAPSPAKTSRHPMLPSWAGP